MRFRKPPTLGSKKNPNMRKISKRRAGPRHWSAWSGIWQCSGRQAPPGRHYVLLPRLATCTGAASLRSETTRWVAYDHVVTDSHALNMDTPSQVRKLQIARWSSAKSVRKAQMVDALCKDTRELARVGLRERFPNASSREQALRLGALTIDRDLMIQAFGWDSELEGR
jgi:hypothetical protein